MAVSAADLGLASLGINNILTGVARKDYLKIKLYDKGGKSQTLTLELAEDALGLTGSIDLTLAFQTAMAVTDAVAGEVEMVTKVKDYSFDPSVESPESSNVAELGRFKFNTQLGQRSVSVPSIRDDLIRPGSRDDIIVEDGLIADNAAKNFVDEFTGAGLLTSATFTLNNMWASNLSKAFRKRGRTFTYRETR